MTDPIDDVAALEQEAAAATALAEELEKRYIDGDESVDPEQIAEQEKLGRWARLKAQRAEVAAEKAREADRMAAIRALRKEIEADESRVGLALDGALRGFDAAEQQILNVADAHYRKVSQWRERAEALNVPDAAPSRALESEGGIRLGHSGSPTALKVGTSLDVTWTHPQALLENYKASTNRPALRAALLRQHGKDA